ncbi:restriction endonuclease [Xylophilus sp. GOD-11R]|uniref:restriction endonuclease n=1 Tax=Xylophilus sp. GOD-11R TaxID=3089814 RepID=UPI00298CDA45|nr:restriction endonuclease [Xylophilus sp. GOD-11R]WPB57368.1 restriction endonuclease [Xylophilus sp. GOD-11R]
MARRRKSSPAEDLIDFVAMMPWWVGIVMAGIAYVGLHAVATEPMPVTRGAATAGQMASAAIWRGLGSIGQYAVPVICLVGALVSAVRRHRRNALFDAASTSNDAAATVQTMSWLEFELLVGEAFRRRGYGLQETGGAGPDGGIDLVLTRGTEKFLVQCKQWKAFKVSVSTVRELYGVMAAEGAAGGFVVTSGTFTRDAGRFAMGRNIELIDGTSLQRLMQQAKTGTKSAVKGPAAPMVVPDAKRIEPVGWLEPMQSFSADQPAAMSCPRCAKPMVLRVARRGASAGRSFWGCSAFSDGCRGIRPV